ncbi:hypothetical protein [Bacillus phage vB_BceS-M2]
MFGSLRKETIPFDSFMKGTWKGEKKAERNEKAVKMLLPLAGLTTFKSVPAFAATPTAAMPVMLGFGEGIGNTIKEKIMDGFAPLIELVQAMGYPVAFICMAGGMLLIMMGQKNKGISMIKWTAIGYVGLQFVPAIMAILLDIGQAIGK